MSRSLNQIFTDYPEAEQKRIIARVKAKLEERLIQDVYEMLDMMRENEPANQS